MALREILLSFMSSLKMHSSDYCDIETLAGYETLVFKDETMLTIIRYDGLLSQVSRDTFYKMINQVARQLNQSMLNSGHKIACMFKKDLDAFSSLARIEAVQKQTVAKLDLDLNDIIEEGIDAARASVYDEEVYFGIMTNKKALNPIELENIKQKAINQAKDPDNHFDAPKLTQAQNILLRSEVLHSKHNEFVERFIGAFRGNDYYVSLEKINAVEALSLIRHQTQPNSSPRKWTPIVALDANTMREQAGVYEYKAPILFPSNDDLDDLSWMMPPDLSRQIFSQNVEVLGAAENLPPDTIRCDGRLYASVFMDIPPTQPAMFNDIFSAFNNSAFKDSRGHVRTMPWSLTFVISGDGMAGSVTKRAFKDIVGLAPPSTNANLKAAYDNLQWLRKNDQAVVGIQVSAMTWVDDVNAKSRETLVNRRNRLKYYMETWGSMKVIDNVGDPVIGWRSNILGMSTEHVGTKGAAPLAEVLAMLPLTRPASAFRHGTVINRTLDGKLMLLEKFSSLMRTWVKCIIGSPGSGKSVMLNNELLETCMMAGLERLPYMTVIDKGISSSGFIELLRDRLPPHKRYLAVTKKLRKEREYAINPFDIKVGLTRPLNDEKTQMVAFLTALITPAEKDNPYTDTQSFLSQMIDLVFDSIQEGSEYGSPNMYAVGSNSELDAYIIDNDFIEFETFDDGTIDYYNPKEQITYFALVRELHKAGEAMPFGSRQQIEAWRARDLAHRLAMPTLANLDLVLSTEKVILGFPNKIDTGESMPKYAKRAVSEAMNSYPCFAHHTQFDVDTARVVSLDLQEVVSKQNKKQSSLFVQIARMIGVRKINLSDEDVKSELIPPLFRDYYRREYDQLQGDKKVLAIDEMHNYRGNSVFMGLLETDAREGRKWGLELILASQSISDFYFSAATAGAGRVDLLNWVTHLCVCTTPEGEDLKIFREYFDPVSSNTGKSKIPTSTLEGIDLDKSGLTYLSCLTTKKAKYNQLLTLQVPHKRLWSLTTTAEDRLIRKYMYELTAGDRTRAIAALATYLPSGAKDSVDNLKNNMMAENNKVSKDELDNRANSLIQTLAGNIYRMNEERLAQERQIIEEY